MVYQNFKASFVIGLCLNILEVNFKFSFENLNEWIVNGDNNNDINEFFNIYISIM
jgi:hypothetical protein